MGFADLVRNGVALANRMTADLQVEVVHESVIGHSRPYNKPEHGEPVVRSAIVVRKMRVVRNAEGAEVVSGATVTFLSDVVVAEGDRITLPDGATAPVVAVGGLADPSTGRPYLPEVALGL